jgi:hypothetical protein
MITAKEFRALALLLAQAFGNVAPKKLRAQRLAGRARRASSGVREI